VFSLSRQVASLVLDDGTRLKGFSFGDWRSVSGEVVFNTGMVGYVESLTDPSYEGQILVMTSPMVGNYGVPSQTEKDEWGLLKHMESHRIHVRGLIVSDYCEEHSHWEAKSSLAEWLKRNHVPALFGVDTRALTKRIRDKNKPGSTKQVRDRTKRKGSQNATRSMARHN
jgi:carbamoyl-phosphate synthase small subunit